MNVQTKYEEWHRGMAEQEHSKIGSLHSWHRVAARFLVDCSNRRILEVGCGRGDFAIWLAEHLTNSEITGIDFSEVAVTTALTRVADSSARSLLRSSVAFETGDAEALRFPDSSFDVVVSCECLEHVSRPTA